MLCFLAEIHVNSHVMSSQFGTRAKPNYREVCCLGVFRRKTLRPLRVWYDLPPGTPYLLVIIPEILE